MIIVIGEILVDCFPDYERIGGAPFNFAYHLKQLGWPVRFISRIGQDAYGEKIHRFLTDKGFPDEDIQIDPRHATGKVAVSLDAHGIPRFTILEQAAYDYIDLPPAKKISESAIDMVYFGTLAQRTPQGFSQVNNFLENTEAATIRFCDINLRAPHINAAAVEASLVHADILKLNTDELAMIGTLCNGPEAAGDIIAWLQTVCAIPTIAITRGDQGSTLCRHNRTCTAPPARVANIVDTVGAGDAYAAVLAAGLLKNLPEALTLKLATRFAADICSLAGAIPADHQLYMNLSRQLEKRSHGQ